jgi:hypothetical protein
MSNNHDLRLARKDFSLIPGSRRHGEERVILRELVCYATRHSNILQCFGGLENGLTYSLFMPLAECNLEQYMEKPLTIPTSAFYKARIIECAAGLAEAVMFLQNDLRSQMYEQISCFNMDLKPQSILVVTSPDDGKQRWKLTDIGMSWVKVRRSSTAAYPPRTEVTNQSERPLDMKKLFMKRPHGHDPRTYLAPETCIMGYPINTESDTWSLGCILSVLLSYLHGGQTAVREFAELRRKNNNNVDTFFAFSGGKGAFGIRDTQVNHEVKKWHKHLLLKTKMERKEEATVFESLIKLLDRKVLIVNPEQRRQTTVMDMRYQLTTACDDFRSIASHSPTNRQGSTSRIRSLGMRRWLRRQFDAAPPDREAEAPQNALGVGSGTGTVAAFRVPMEEYRTPIVNDVASIHGTYLKRTGAEDQMYDTLIEPRKGHDDRAEIDLGIPTMQDEDSMWHIDDGIASSPTQSINTDAELGIEGKSSNRARFRRLSFESNSEVHQPQAEDNPKFEYNTVPESEVSVLEEKHIVGANLPWMIDKLLESLSITRHNPPIPTDHVRAWWTCVSTGALMVLFALILVQTCGLRLFDDFIEREPGAVQELEKELALIHTPISTKPGGYINEKARGLWTAITQSFSLQQHPSPTAGNVLPLHQPSQSSPAAAQAGASQQHAQPPPVTHSFLYVLLCVDEGSARPLHQRKLKDTTTDRELFLSLRSKYYEGEHFKHWFTLRSVASLSLSRVRPSTYMRNGC